MKNLNIFVEKKRFTQFHGINQTIVGDYRVNILDGYNLAIRDGKLETNIDIFFVGHHNTNLELSEFQHLLDKRLVYVKQHKKSSMLSALNQVIDDPNYHPANIHGCFNAQEDWSEYIFEPSIYYVKPEHGARSLNQFIVDSRKVSLGHFLQQLKTFHEAKEDQAEYLRQLVAQANGHIKHIKGHERFENEHASLRSSFCVHERIADIVKEYRVVSVGFGSAQYFLERIRNQSNDGVISNEIEYAVLDTLPCQKIQNALQKAFRKLNIFHGALDVVITASGKWSIIEVSNQFGGGDIPPSTKTAIAQDTLKHLINHCISS